MKKAIPYIVSSLIGALALFSYVLGFYLVFGQASIGPFFIILAPAIVLVYVLLVIFVPMVKQSTSTLVYHFRVSLLFIPVGMALVFLIGNILDTMI